MAEQKLRRDILSTANIGRVAVIPVIQSSKNGKVVAVAGKNSQKGTEFAFHFGILGSYDSHEAMLDEPDYPPLPNSLHCDWTMKAARPGKHILCKKPLALTSAQCLEMDAATQEWGVPFLPGKEDI